VAVSRFGTSGQSRGSGGVSVSFQNAQLVRDILSEVEDTLKRETNSELRQAAKDIARKVVIPQLQRSARSSPMKIAPAMAATARPKADRVVTVQIGGVNPALSGFKRGVGVNAAASRHTGRAKSSRNYRTTLAWGSEFGPFPGADVNHYAQPRRAGGYWVHQGITNSIPDATKRYEKLLEEIIRTKSRFR
jgi:hypothetical protein